MRRQRFLVFLAAVFAAKLVAVLQLRAHPLLQLASPYPFVEPVYLWFLTALLSVTNVLAAVRVVQIALGTAAVACVFTATRTWFGERAAWLAALFAALTGLFTFYETTLLPSALDPFLTAAALAAFATGMSGRRAWLAPAAIAFALLLLNRPAFVNSGLYFYIGNNATADGTYRPMAGVAADDLRQQRDDARNIAEASTGRKLDGLRVSAYFFDLGRSWIRLHPADAVMHFGRKLGLVLNAGHLARSYSFPFFASDANTVLAALFVGPWLLLPLGLLGLALGVFHLRRRDYLTWAAFVPVFALGTAVFFVTERDRLPLLVPLCIGAGAAAELFMSRGSRPSALVAPLPARKLALTAAIVLCGLALLTNRRLRHDDGRAEDRTRMAEAMIVRDQVDAAEQWAAQAIAIHPRPAEVDLRVGRRLIVHSRPEAALVHLERASRIDPSSADVNLAMGQALVQAGRPREAIPRLRAAMTKGASNSLAGYEVARALAAAGDRAEALQTLQAVRPELPSDVERWNALGRLALQLESPGLAVAFFEGALAAAPRSAGTHRDLGVALAQLGRRQDALAHLEQAAALDPADRATATYLAQLRQMLKERK